eukprot:m51a1_g5962 putative EMP70 family protein (597) ;mRNA; r:166004-168001
MRGAMSTIVAAVLLLAAVAAVADARRHEYRVGQNVPLYVNNIGPYHNPTELYPYNKLPFCPLVGKKPQSKPTTLADRLEGDRPLKDISYNISFRIDLDNAPLCTRPLSVEDIETFKKAIQMAYYYEQFCDDLPIRGFIGFSDPPEPSPLAQENRYYLYLHMDFSISYNNNKIVQINATSDKSRVLELGDAAMEKVAFSYSVKWQKTNYPFRHRMSLYKDTFFAQELEIHWLSVMNSIVLVVLLTGFLAIIVMRVLKNDFTRYESRTDVEEANEDPDDYGWKLVHGDVFRFMPNKTLFSAFVGIGMQWLWVAFGLFALSFLGVLHPEMGGTLYVSVIVLYALTAGTGGFYASRLYRQFGGERWAWPIVLSATLFSIPLLCLFIFVNSAAAAYGSSTALRFTTIIQVFSILFFIGLPLQIIGGILGRRTADNFKAPCRTKGAVREIPSIPWYRTTPFQMMISGFLPFSAIYIELFYIYASVWGHSYYSLYGILFVVFIILLLVAACITVALTYFQLSMEDYRWWWNSFFCGGSTGLFVYAYSIFYYAYRTRMSGFLQGAFYFGYTGAACYLIFLMLGSVGFYSSLFFVRYIYSQIKVD